MSTPDGVWSPPIWSPNACLRTFLVQKLEHLRPAFFHHIPEAFRANLAGVLLLTHSFGKEEFTAFATEFLCPCFHITTLGTSGWNAVLGINHEVEQEGQGYQFGGPGVAFGGAAIVVIAVLNQAKRVALSSDSAPGLAEGALGHIFFGAHEHQASVAEFLLSPKQAVCAGGISLKIWKMGATLHWTEVAFVVVTLLDDGNTLFNVSCTDVLNPEPACRDRGRDMIQSLPEGYRPELLGYFPCIMRGQNRYAEPNVEAKGLDQIIGQDIPVLGFSTLGEIGNNTVISNPDGWNACRPSSTAIYQGATVYALLAVKDEAGWKPKPRGLNAFACLQGPQDPPRVASSPTDDSLSQLFHHWFGTMQSSWPLTLCCESKGGMCAAVTMERVTAEPVLAQVPCIHNGSDLKVPTSNVNVVKRASFTRVLRGIPLTACGGGSTEAVGFWIPEKFSNEKLFGLSFSVPLVDVFLSQVIRPPPGANQEMWAFSKSLDVTTGAADIALRLCHEDPAKVPQMMDKMTFWVDRACVNQDGGDEKMQIIHDHLEDFLLSARYVCCLISEQYFTRLWCIFEICCSFAYRDMNTIIVGGISVAMRLPYAQQIAHTIVHLSVASAQCFDPADRHIIEDKITANFVSIEHFEAFAQIAALGLVVRDALGLIVEYENFVMWELWLNTVKECQFGELEVAMQGFDIADVHQRLLEMYPDTPSATQTSRRLKECYKTFVRPWFDAKVAPILLRERARASIKAKHHESVGR